MNLKKRVQIKKIYPALKIAGTIFHNLSRIWHNFLPEYVWKNRKILPFKGRGTVRQSIMNECV